MIESIIRITITFVLIYFAYGETGWATALCLFFIMTDIEVRTLNESRTPSLLDKIIQNGRN